MEIPQLIIDLSLMLTTAAIVTIVFRKFKIPAILGYILAGFFISPYFPLFLDINSTKSIEVWSEIGVVIILFHIGLEFDFNKLKEVGGTAIVSAAVKMGGVMFVGYGFGKLLGMTTMDSIYLGAMISISSTVVIQKCFSEMGLRHMKYTKLIMGSLVMEDVIAVFMMVVLTTVAAGQNQSSTGVATHLFLMTTYLIIWLLLGIFLLPTALDKAMQFMNDETLTLLSIGFCFLMALVAHKLGFSMELGAFIAGSLFAGTRHSHEVERVTSGIKDMFGAIFFLSVGMMVDPSVIVSRWTTILPIAIIAVIAKLIFATIGMVLSGQDLDTSLKGGISLAPIGEFSFIIAGLGISLGVIDKYLYPVIVAASILTIIATPILIRHSESIVARILKILPAKLELKLNNYTSDKRQEEVSSSEWSLLLKEYFLKIIVYGSIMVVAAFASNSVLFPVLSGVIGKTAARWIVTIFVYAVVIIFARPFMGTRSAAFTSLWMERLTNRPPLAAMVVLKVIILGALLLMPLIDFFDIHFSVLVILIPIVIVFIARSEFISTYYLQLETRFFANLNQKTMAERGGERSHQHWLNEDYNIFRWTIPEGAQYVGKALKDLNWGRRYSVYAVKLKRGDRNTVMPPSRTVLQVGDILYVIGEKQPLESFYKALGIKKQVDIKTLKDFLEAGYEDTESALACAAFKVRGTENYVGKPIKSSGISMRGHCMILGLERDGYATHMPDANMLIEQGDILWIVGTERNVQSIAAHSIGEVGSHSN